MKSIQTKRAASVRHIATARRPPARRNTVAESPQVKSTESSAFSGSTSAALGHPSCSRFDLNRLLTQLVNDARETSASLQRERSVECSVEPTVLLRAELCPEPMPVFANVAHLSLALQELVRFLVKFLRDGEAVALATAPSSARELLERAGSARHVLFPLSTWNVTQNSQRAFGVITIIKEGAAIPDPLIERFLRAARNAGNAKDGELGIQRLGRVLRKHRINLVINSKASAGTIFHLFVSLADAGK